MAGIYETNCCYRLQQYTADEGSSAGACVVDHRLPASLGQKKDRPVYVVEKETKHFQNIFSSSDTLSPKRTAQQTHEATHAQQTTDTPCTTILDARRTCFVCSSDRPLSSGSSLSTARSLSTEKTSSAIFRTGPRSLSNGPRPAERVACRGMVDDNCKTRRREIGGRWRCERRAVGVGKASERMDLSAPMHRPERK